MPRAAAVDGGARFKRYLIPVVDSSASGRNKRQDRTFRKSRADNGRGIAVSQQRESRDDGGGEWSCFGMPPPLGRTAAATTIACTPEEGGSPLGSPTTPPAPLPHSVLPAPVTTTLSTPAADVSFVNAAAVAAIGGVRAQESDFELESSASVVDVFGSTTILSMKGRGPQGRVMIKTIAESGMDSVAVARMCALLHQLSSPTSNRFLCRILGSVRSNSISSQLPPVLMEGYFRGSLEEIFASGKPPPPPIIAARIGLGIALGLSSIHCDFKTAHGALTGNSVLIRADWSPCITDVGIAPYLPDRLERLPPAWLAPEIVAALAKTADLGGKVAASLRGAITQQSDIFSLGGLLCEIFFLERPSVRQAALKQSDLASSTAIFLGGNDEGADVMDTQEEEREAGRGLPHGANSAMFQYSRVYSVMVKCWNECTSSRPSIKAIGSLLEALCKSLSCSAANWADHSSANHSEMHLSDWVAPPVRRPQTIASAFDTSEQRDEEVGDWNTLMYGSPS